MLVVSTAAPELSLQYLQQTVLLEEGGAATS